MTRKGLYEMSMYTKARVIKKQTKNHKKSIQNFYEGVSLSKIIYQVFSPLKSSVHSIQKQPPEMFIQKRFQKFCRFYRKSAMLKFLFNKSARLQINRNKRKKCLTCLKLTIKATERCHWRRRFGIFMVSFERISHIFLVFLEFKISRLWTSKC